MLEDYWRLMPEYQNIDLSDLQPLRILFGFFPTYRQVVITSSLRFDWFTDHQQLQSGQSYKVH